MSPYLFIIVMTALFHDVEKEKSEEIRKNRIGGTEFDEVFFADYTICISAGIEAMEGDLHIIERIGEQYGMKINKEKCELMMIGMQGSIRFRDGT